MSLRVLEILPTLKRAGAEQVAVSLALGLRRYGCETRVLSLYDAFPGGFEDLLKREDIPVMHLGKRRGLDLRMIPRLRAAFREFQPHILHTHSYLLRYVLPAHAGFRDSRIVHTVHNLALREVDAIGRCIHRIAFRTGVLPVAVGEQVARSMAEVYGIHNVATIPNGIALRRFQRPASGIAWRSSHGFQESDRLAVSVARLEPQKNPLGLLDAFAAAFPTPSPWHLLLAGDGTLRDETARCAEALGIAPRVHLLGVQSDVAPILSAAQCFVLASHWEGNPLAVMEALAAGLPIVATAVGSVPELARHGVEGLLVPPGNPALLACALRDLAADDALRTSMGQAAFARAADFSEDAMVAAYARLFATIAGGHR